MKKGKQIMAIICVIFLIGLYVTTFVVACFSSEASPGMFLACLYATITIPVLMWAYQFVYKLTHKNKDESNDFES